MSSDTELVVLFAMLHLVALAAGGALLLFALRAGDRYDDTPRGPGPGGSQPPDAPRRPVAGPPLGTAAPARFRLREPGRLADLLPPPSRRGTREPNPPARRPAITPARPRR